MDFKKYVTKAATRAAINAGESISAEEFKKPTVTTESSVSNTASGLLETYLENTTKEERIETIERTIKSVIKGLGPKHGAKRGLKGEELIPDALQPEEVLEYVKAAVRTTVDSTLKDIPQEERIEIIDHVIDKIMTRPARLRQPLLADQTRQELLELAKFATVRLMNDVPVRLVAEGKEIAKDVIVHVKRSADKAADRLGSAVQNDACADGEIESEGEKREVEGAFEWLISFIRTGIEGARAISSEILAIIRQLRNVIAKFTVENPVLLKIKDITLRALEKTEDIIELIFGKAVVLVSDVIAIFTELFQDMITGALDLLVNNPIMKILKELVLGREERYGVEEEEEEEEGHVEVPGKKDVRAVVKGVLEKKEAALVERLGEADVSIEKAKADLGVSDEAMAYIVADLVRKDSVNVKLSAKKRTTVAEKAAAVEPKPTSGKVRIMKAKEPVREETGDVRKEVKETKEVKEVKEAKEPREPKGDRPSPQPPSQIHPTKAEKDKENGKDEKEKDSGKDKGDGMDGSPPAS